MTSIRSFIQKLIGKRTFITVVSGLPRSGTSMMMSALKAGGMDVLTDEVRVPDDNNPKGYYEYERVKKLPKGDTEWLHTARGKAVKIISPLLTHLPADYHYRVIFMERDIEEILASQERMLERTGKGEENSIPDEAMRQSYHDHLAEVDSWLADKSWISVIRLSYNDILRQPENHFRKVATFLDDIMDPRAMSRVVDPSLYREKN